MIKNRLLCIGVLLVSFSFVFFSGGKVPYLFLYSVLTVLAVSVIHVLLTAVFCVAYYELSEGRIVKGETLTANLVVKNRSLFFLPYVFIVDKKMAAFDILDHINVISVAPMGKEKIPFGVVGKYRGRYELDFCELSIMDFLGVISVKRKVRNIPKVNVYPRLHQLDSFDDLERLISGTNVSVDRIEEDMLAVSDIRNYIAGDSPKRIHWKVSARMQSLMSKNYENETHTRLNFILDLSAIKEEPEVCLAIEDKTVETALSLAYYVLGKHCNIRLSFNGDDNDVTMYYNENMFESFYTMLSVIEFASNRGVAHLLENIEFETDGSMEALIITCDLSELLIRKMHDLSGIGCKLMLIYVHSGQLSEEEMTLLRRVSVLVTAYRTVPLDAKLHEVLC